MWPCSRLGFPCKFEDKICNGESVRQVMLVEFTSISAGGGANTLTYASITVEVLRDKA